MRRAARTDANQQRIVDALRQCGATVQSLAAVGNGVPDLLIGYRGCTALVEVKDGDKSASRRVLTPDQERWHAAWRGGTLAIVGDVDAAIRVLRTMA